MTRRPGARPRTPWRRLLEVLETTAGRPAAAAGVLPGHGFRLGPPDRIIVVGRAKWWRAMRHVAAGVLAAVALLAVAARTWSPEAMLAAAVAVGLLVVVMIRRLRRHLTRVSPTGVRGVPTRRRLELDEMYGLRLKAPWRPGDPAPAPVLVDGLDVEVRVGTYEGNPVIRSLNLDLFDETPDARLGVLGVVRGWVLARPELTRDQSYLWWCLAIPTEGVGSWFQPFMRARNQVLWESVPGFVPHPVADRRHVPRAGVSEWAEPTVEVRTQTAHRLATVLNGFATVTWWLEEFRPAGTYLDLDLDVLSLTIPWPAAPAHHPGWPEGVVELVRLRVWPRHVRVSVLRTPHPELSALTDQVLDALMPVLGPQVAEPRGPHWATTIHRRRDRG